MREAGQPVVCTAYHETFAPLILSLSKDDSEKRSWPDGQED